MLPEQVVLNCVVPPMRVFSLALPANVPANTLLVLQRLVHLLVLDPVFLIEACNIAKERIIQRREMELQGLRFGRQPVASNQNPIPPAGSQIRPDGQYQHSTQPQMQPQVPSQNPNPLQQFLYDQQQEARLGPQGEAAFAQRLNNAQLQTQPQHQVQNPMSLPQNIRIPPPPLAPQPGYGATPAHVVPSATPAPHAQGPVLGLPTWLMRTLPLHLVSNSTSISQVSLALLNPPTASLPKLWLGLLSRLQDQMLPPWAPPSKRLLDTCKPRRQGSVLPRIPPLGPALDLIRHRFKLPCHPRNGPSHSSP